MGKAFALGLPEAGADVAYLMYILPTPTDIKNKHLGWKVVYLDY